MSISIAQAKQVREQLGLTKLVLFGVDADGTTHVATHGQTEADAKDAADAGNWLKRELHWSEGKCNSKPLERICSNCAYHKPDPMGMAAALCLVEPKPVNRHGSYHACRHFEPKG